MGGIDDRHEMTRAAVLGTGIMGSAMARNLLAAGLPTTVWDRSAAVTAQLAGAAPRSPRRLPRQCAMLASSSPCCPPRMSCTT